MDGVEERLARLEGLLTGAEVAAPPPRPPLALRFASWMGAELPKLLAAAVLLVLGFALKDSVDLAIKQRQLDLSYSKEMQGLLQQLAGGGALPQLQSAAVVLASYGDAALPALMSELRYTGLRGDAALEGLNVLALRDPEAVCAALPRVLGLRKQYDWLAQERVALLLGQHGCGKQARTALQRYRALVAAAAQGKPAAFEALVREPPAGPQEVYPRLVKSVDAALAMLDPS
ncbi:MAG TPA: hypothetical protein VJN44_09515 [Roseateles sp.]|nr:hypothetical protein [Roseateles sp.]